MSRIHGGTLYLSTERSDLFDADLQKGREGEQGHFNVVCRDTAGQQMTRGGEHVLVSIVHKDKKNWWVSGAVEVFLHSAPQLLRSTEYSAPMDYHCCQEHHPVVFHAYSKVLQPDKSAFIEMSIMHDHTAVTETIPAVFWCAHTDLCPFIHMRAVVGSTSVINIGNWWAAFPHHSCCVTVQRSADFGTAHTNLR